MMRRMLRLRRAMSACIGPAGRSVPVLSGLQGRLFRGAPLVAWLAAWAWNDLRSPDSLIKDIAGRMIHRVRLNQHLVAVDDPPAALDGPDKNRR